MRVLLGVDIMAHSQGGPVSSQYLKFDGGADKVDKRTASITLRALDPDADRNLDCTFNPGMIGDGAKL
ncbi:hypothetical protein [Nocardia sp. CA-120079]|uniref:hypothetical protein n=1 Tax=Nocardia sp. CA-120079 TaxID=3239974 RepID=UPI003D96890E